MKHARALLTELRRRGASLSVRDGRLSVRAPPGVLDDELRRGLAEHKAAILELLREASAATRADDEAIPPCDAAPVLSSAQRRLWFLQRLAPDNSSYNLGHAARLTGALDSEALLHGLEQLARRHDVLRWTVPELDGQPVVRVLDDVDWSLPCEDLTALPTDAREAAARRAVEAFRRRPFQLDREPPLRVALWRLGDHEHVLLVVLHHLAGDAWSLDLLMREWSALAGAWAEGRAPGLAPLPIRYADYAHWERGEGQQARQAAGLDAWRERLADAAPLDLPTDRPRPPRPSFAGARASVRLPTDLVTGLEALGRARGASLQMVLLAGFAALLQRQGAGSDVVVGAPVSGRSRVELEGLIGCFVNMLALRVDLDGDPDFGELVERVRHVCLEAYAHQDVPFDAVVEALGGRRDASRNPVFQVFFDLAERAPSLPLLPGVVAAPFRFDYGTTDLDLDVFLSRGDDGWTVDVLYATDLFGAATVEAMVAAFRPLLEAALAAPGRPLSELAAQVAVERDSWLLEGDDTGAVDVAARSPRHVSDAERASPDQAGGARFASLPERVARQARERPQRVAVAGDAGELTYAQLWARVARLAAELAARGVEAGDVVGVAVERGPLLPVALLAVQACGAAYLPLDPGFPAERLAWILADGGARLVVSERALADRLPDDGPPSLWLDDVEWSAPADPAWRPRPVGADDLAYVLHTSGSTGRPKGVEVRHGGLARFLDAMARRPGCGPDDVLLAITTVSFDIAVLELFLPLVVGGRVEIAGRQTATSGHALAGRLARGDISVMQATPAGWQMLRAAGWRGDPRLTLLCGGEELPRALADDLLDRGAALWNLYGPTEATVWSAVERVAPADGPVPLGRPLDGTRLLLLDEHLRPVPRGAAGELCIAGDGLARGYRGLPELTAERFVTAPEALGVSGRLYRTGDLVRLDADGRLVFLGRRDSQVKLRGFRIELGEVEAGLAALPGVERAAALVHGRDADCRRLLAFWTGAERDADALLAGLATRLPAYMLPSALWRLDALPLTAAGKLDRRRLAELVPDVARPAGPAREAEGAVEAGVLAAFRELLDAPELDATADFFASGGHSLLATGLVSRLRAAFGVELGLVEVFEATDVAALSRRIDALRRSGRRLAEQPVALVPRHRPLALSPSQQRLWVLDQMGAGRGYHMRLEIGLHGRLDLPALRAALDAVVARHEGLRTRFVELDGRPVQVVDAAAPLAWDVVERHDLHTAGEREALLAAHGRADLERPFDLARGPLLRPALFRWSDDEAVLSLAFHHVLADGASYDLLADELAAHYRALLTGETPRVPALPVQVADVAAWQLARLDEQHVAGQLAFWERELARLPPPLELPSDRPRPAALTYDGASHSLSLGREPTAELRSLAQRHEATLAMLCLAVFDVLLMRASGQRDVVVGAPMAHRTRPELEPLIGFFVNTLVLRVDLSGDPTFVELLERVKARSLAAYDHQDVPFERLVEALAPERDPTRTPLFGVVFAMNAGGPRDPGGAGLRFRPRRADVAVTRFDLELHVFDRGEGLEITFVYATALFDADTIAGLAQAYRCLLGAVVATPRAPLSALPLQPDDLGRAEHGRWNSAAVERADAGAAHGLVEDWARRTPGAPAVEFGERTLTYAELDARAARLAGWLVERGVGRDVLVGLCLERGPDVVVGLLAILKAGGAYLPLDPAYPAERLAFMVADAGIALVVCESSVAAALPEGLERLLLDREAEALAARPLPALPAVDGGDLAYAIFTSGSTGRPKAALLEHAGLCNLAHEQGAVFDVGPGTRVLQFASLSFDAATFEVFMALAHGATLVMGTRHDLLPGPDLAGFLARRRIQLVTLPPTALAALPRLELPELATITVAGEACPAELVRRWAPGRRFFNLYGPTETTVWASVAELRPGDRPHIGRPIGNLRIDLYDEQLRPVPRGFPGEIGIAGRGVARGYLGRPELEAERFVRDPLADADDADGRLYRTGDLGRRRADGSLEFLGRIDSQQKLRGHRIEPGEIEAVVGSHAGVADCHVMLREDQPGERRLVAYVVPAGEAAGADDASHAPGRRAEQQHVDRWRALYEQSYAGAAEGVEPTFDTTAWDSSYDGRPIPAAEMRVWLNHTLAALRATAPRQVLEIGCGLGLILFGLAPHCEAYHACDLSQAALGSLAGRLSALPAGSAAVTLEQRAAHQLEGLPRGHFDLVVLNSVVQYLAGVEQLLDVLEQAAGTLRPGGRLFLGDLRSLPLMEAFHASVICHQQGLDPRADERPGDAAEGLRRRLAQERELLVDPALFARLERRVPSLRLMAVRPKRGRYENELSRFRYDVELRRVAADEVASSVPGATAGAVAAGAVDEPAPIVVDWDVGLRTPERLRARLVDERPARMVLRGVPNARCAAALDQARWLREAVRPAPSTDATGSPTPGVDPEDLIAMAEALDYDAEASWAAADAEGRFDVLLTRRGPGSPPAAPLAPASWCAGSGAADRVCGAAAALDDWERFGNRPALSGAADALIPALREHAARQLPEFMLPAAWVLLESFPVTPNGKRDLAALPPPSGQRPALADAYAAPSNAREALLTEVWQGTLGIDRVGVHDDFFALGGDSILAIHLAARARERGLLFSVKDLFGQPTVAGLAALARDVAAAPAAEQGPVRGTAPLTPIQRWFLDGEPVEPQHFVQALVLETDRPCDPQRLGQALLVLCARHDALRSRFVRGPAGWHQELGPLPDAVLLEQHDLAGHDGPARDAFTETCAARLASGLDLDCGLLLAGALIDTAPGERQRLLLLAHHLVVDAVSWTPLLQDLERALEQLEAGTAPADLALPAKTSSWLDWCAALGTAASDPVMRERAGHWLSLPWAEAARLPVDHPEGEDTLARAAAVSGALDTATTARLARHGSGATLEQLLLVAVARSLAHWTARDVVLLDVEGHGRQELVDGLDLSRTVGWFTTLHPALLRVDRAARAGDDLASLRSQLEATPQRGLPFGLVATLGEDDLAQRLAGLPRPEVVVNFLGDFDQALGSGRWRWVGSPHDASRSPRALRTHAFEVQAHVADGALRLRWSHASGRHDEATVRGLVEHCLDDLRGLAVGEPGGAAPAETGTPGAGFGWSADDLSDLLGEIEKRG